jgi:hypothetical protein
MFFQVLGEDEDVVDVYAYNAAADEILQDVNHHGLESGWAVSHAIQHYQWFKESSVTLEGHFPFLPFLDSDVLVAQSDIEFGEVFAAA